MHPKDFSFISFDIETTGLDPDSDEIIELGAACYKKGLLEATFTTVVKPNKTVPNFIKLLTGITEEEFEKGLPLDDALNRLTTFIDAQSENEPLPIVCHNCSFDMSFIRHNLSNLNLELMTNPMVDTLILSRIYLPFLPNHKLGTIKNTFLSGRGNSEQMKRKQLRENNYEALNNPHRALYDAVIAGEILIKLTNLIVEYFAYNLNSFIRDIAVNSFSGQYVDDYLTMIIRYQSKQVLSQQQPSLEDSPLGKKLGFDKSYNVIEAKKHTAENSSEPDKQSDKDHTAFVDYCFSADGYIGRNFAGYKYRDGQVSMSKGVQEAFYNGEYLLVEAGTGIGKTFAYLVPALEFTYTQSKKVLVSTNTKNLQEQIFFKDLPQLRDSLPLPFKAVLLKGRENYLCIRKWEDMINARKRILSQWEQSMLLNLVVWQYYTRTGDIAENSSFPKETSSGKGGLASLWKKLSSDRYFCSGRHCPYQSKCFYRRIRIASELADLIIINHHLLFADLNSNKIVTDDSYLVIDEAHNLPDLASQYLGISLAFFDFSNFLSHLFIIRKDYQAGILAKLKADIKRSKTEGKLKDFTIAEIDKTIDSIEEKKIVFDSFFQLVSESVEEGDGYGKCRIKEPKHQELIPQIEELVGIMTDSHNRLIALSQSILQIDSNLLNDYDEHQEKLNGAAESARDLIEALKIIKAPDWDNYVFWNSSFNVADKKYPNGIVNYSPIDVAELLQQVLYSKIKSLVFASATLSLRENFKFYKNLTGLNLLEKKEVAEMIIPSPFDYDKQTKVVVAKYLPNHTDKFFHPQSIDLLKGVLSSTRVGTMILFTSYRDLNMAYQQLNQFLYEKDITLLAQGKGFGRTTLLNEFKNHDNAVLLGTSSFWEGVDIPGNSLSLLVLYKLPFQVPSEPVIEAYYDKLRKNNKDPFMHATLPNAMLRFRQGFGRLIRNHSDTGVVLILDSRLVNKRYGIYFREVLPTRLEILSSPLQVEDNITGWFRKKRKLPPS